MTLPDAGSAPHRQRTSAHIVFAVSGVGASFEGKAKT